jgi:hypothetical protein
MRGWDEGQGGEDNNKDNKDNNNNKDKDKDGKNKGRGSVGRGTMGKGQWWPGWQGQTHMPRMMHSPQQHTKDDTPTTKHHKG